MKTIKLLEPEINEGITVMQSMMWRHTSREFSTEPLALKHISEIMWAAYGVNRVDGKRTVPSAWGLYPLVVYAFTAEGTYRYEPVGHELVEVSDRDLRADAGLQDFVATAPLDIVIFSDFTKFVTGDTKVDERLRGNQMRLSALDAAASTQNVYLYCTGENLNVVERALADEVRLRSALGLPDTMHFTIAMTVGHAK